MPLLQSRVFISPKYFKSELQYHLNAAHTSDSKLCIQTNIERGDINFDIKFRQS